MIETKKHCKSTSAVWFLTIFWVVSISVFAWGYAFAWTCTSTPAQCLRYQQACEDASGELTPDRIYDGLTVISPRNLNLIWKDGVVGSKVLVAAYKYGTPENPPFATCQPGVDFPKDCPVSGSPWVTVVPELYNFFKTAPFSTLRLEQLLGLPPNYGNNYIVEYWADPRDLFRPAMDPQIVYQEGTVQFPWDSSRFLSMNTGAEYSLVWDDYCTISTDPDCSCTSGAQYVNYQCWFQNRRAWVYSFTLSSAPYPWTGLGYTYDWGNVKTPVGLSEFVLNKAPAYNPFMVTIQSVTVASDYFRRRQKSNLALTKSGLGKGTVTSSPAGIRCGTRCSAISRSFDKYSEVTLTAKSAVGSTFTGWSGACSGAAFTCTIPMVSDLNVTAHFSATP